MTIYFGRGYSPIMISTIYLKSKAPGFYTNIIQQAVLRTPIILTQDAPFTKYLFAWVKFYEIMVSTNDLVNDLKKNRLFLVLFKFFAFAEKYSIIPLLNKIMDKIPREISCSNPPFPPNKYF